jgi:hypothetical protein
MAKGRRRRTRKRKPNDKLKRSNRQAFVRTKRKESASPRRWNPIKRLSKKDHKLETITTNKQKAQSTADWHRKRGKNARVVTADKVRKGHLVNVQTGPKKGRFAVYTSPKTRRKRI